MLTMDYQGLKEKFQRPKKKPNAKGKPYISYWERLESSESQKCHSKPSKPEKGTDTKVSYQEQLRDHRWLVKRASVLKRDKYKCVLCGSTDNLQVHHTKYIKGRNAWEYPNYRLVTLCKDCHRKVHDDKNHKLNPDKNNH